MPKGILPKKKRALTALAHLNKALKSL